MHSVVEAQGSYTKQNEPITKWFILHEVLHVVLARVNFMEAGQGVTE